MRKSGSQRRNGDDRRRGEIEFAVVVASGEIAVQTNVASHKEEEDEPQQRIVGAETLTEQKVEVYHQQNAQQAEIAATIDAFCHNAQEGR